MAGTGNRLDFGFGVFPYSYVSFEETAQLAKLGDALGYYAFTLPEHLLTPSWPQAPISTKFWYDTMVLGSYIAAITTKVKLLTSVSVVPYHPPVQMAKALATLDVASAGRVLYGVGSGWMKAEFRRLGIPFKERAAITEEYLPQLRSSGPLRRRVSAANISRSKMSPHFRSRRSNPAYRST